MAVSDKVYKVDRKFEGVDLKMSDMGLKMQNSLESMTEEIGH